MQISDSKKYEGRIYEAKDNFLVETPIGENTVSIQHIGDFINSILPMEYLIIKFHSQPFKHFFIRY